jgi:outer membrane protein assembly factor BamB
MATIIGSIPGCLVAEDKTVADSDWPQFRGQNRDGVVVKSSKLLDSWPAEGPPLLWKSEFIPSYVCGGVGNPVVAEGKVFLYSNRKQPLDGGQKYKFLNTQYLLDIGWNPDLSADLAKKIEDARTASNRPPAGSTAPPWNSVDRPTDAELDAYLAKNPELDKYIKEFVSKLDAGDAQKFGAYIKRRFCMRNAGAAFEVAYSWDKLVKMSSLRDWECDSDFDFRCKLGHVLGSDDNLMCARIYRATTFHDTVYCLDTQTGKTLWKQDFPLDEEVAKAITHLGDWGRVPGYLGVFGVSSTPMIWSGKCCVGGANGLYCFSTKDGSVLWRAKTNINNTPTHASPLVADGIVYHQGSAFNADDGKPLWSAVKEGFGSNFESPALWTSGGKNYIIAFSACSSKGWNNKWGCLEMATGKVLWFIDDVAGGDNLSTPTVSGDFLILPNCPRQEIRRYKLSPTEAHLIWKCGGEKEKNVNGNWVYWQNNLYLFAGVDRYSSPRVECLDWETGVSKWKSESYKDAGVSIVPPIVADGKMFNTFCPGNDHATRSAWRADDPSYGYHLEMVRASPEGGYTRLGKFSPGICNFSSPAIADGRLYLRLEKCIASYDLRAK